LQQVQNSSGSSTQQQAEVQRLTKLLQDSQTTIAGLQASLASAEPDLQAKLKVAQDQAKALEQQLVLWKITTGVGVAGAIAALIYAALKK
jgi:hypothetical protein